MKLLETVPSLAVAGATTFGQKYLESELAECRFYLDEQCVYEAPGGTYYFHPMAYEQCEFFHVGQMEPIADLAPVESRYNNQLTILQEHASILCHFALDLIAIERYNGEKMPKMTFYSKEQQTFFTTDPLSLSNIEAGTPPSLLELGVSGNALANPCAVVVDNNGRASFLEVQG